MNVCALPSVWVRLAQEAFQYPALTARGTPPSAKFSPYRPPRLRSSDSGRYPPGSPLTPFRSSLSRSPPRRACSLSELQPSSGGGNFRHEVHVAAVVGAADCAAHLAHTLIVGVDEQPPPRIGILPSSIICVNCLHCLIIYHVVIVNSGSGLASNCVSLPPRLWV